MKKCIFSPLKNLRLAAFLYSRSYLSQLVSLDGSLKLIAIENKKEFRNPLVLNYIFTVFAIFM